MLGTDRGMETLSLADARTPFWVRKDIRWGLRSWQPSSCSVPHPEREAGLGARWKRVARRPSGGVGSMTSPGLVGDFV